MPSYSYKAFDSEGSVQSGFINAESERLARKEIKSLNLIPHKLKEIKSQTTKRYKIKNKDLVLATRQIGTLLEAAAQIDEALKMTAEQVKNKDLRFMTHEPVGSHIARRDRKGGRRSNGMFDSSDPTAPLRRRAQDRG